MVKTDEGLVLANVGATNVKIPKDGVIGLWATDTMFKKNCDGFQYSMSMKTHVYDHEKEKKTTLEKYVQDGRETKSVFKYKDFPPGTIPKVMVRENEKKTYQFDTKGEDKDVILNTIEACRSLQCASLVWVMRFNVKALRAEPHGVALLANKQIVVPGDGEFSLK